MWDEACAEKYEKWFQSPAGAFALEQEKRLITRSISHWPRRGSKLLDVGCGTGVFTEMFWEAGFDVTGLDISPPMITMARQRMNNRAELRLGSADNLFFADDEFDYVALCTVLEFMQDPLKVLQEAVRVAQKGVLVSFLNRYSLYYASHGLRASFLPASLLREANWFSSFELRALLHEATGCPKRVRFSSVLPGPKWTWRENSVCRVMNGLVLPFCSGSYCAARMDLLPYKPLTPLFSMNRAQPRMSS